MLYIQALLYGRYQWQIHAKKKAMVGTVIFICFHSKISKYDRVSFFLFERLMENGKYFQNRSMIISKRYPIIL